MVTAEECYSAKPLLKFSAYTDSQSQAVKDLGNEVLSLLTKVEIMSAYNRFWFWTLGAYEALRPMTDYLTCFDGPGLFSSLNFEGFRGFPRAKMCESISDNPNRRLSNDGVAVGDFALGS